jgi:hypothetical protein
LNTSSLFEYLSKNITGAKIPRAFDENNKKRSIVFAKVVYLTPNHALVNFVAPFNIKINPKDVINVPKI